MNNQALLIIVANSGCLLIQLPFLSRALLMSVAWQRSVLGVRHIELVVIAVEGLIYKLKGVSELRGLFQSWPTFASVSVGILVQTLI